MCSLNANVERMLAAVEVLMFYLFILTLQCGLFVVTGVPDVRNFHGVDVQKKKQKNKTLPKQNIRFYNNTALQTAIIQVQV